MARKDVRICRIYHGREELFRVPLNLGNRVAIEREYSGGYILVEGDTIQDLGNYYRNSDEQVD